MCNIKFLLICETGLSGLKFEICLFNKFSVAINLFLILLRSE